MAEHIWSVLCYKAIRDAETNQTSLLDVIESITIHASPPEKGEDLNIGQQLNIVTFCMRSDWESPEKGVLQFSLKYPNGEETSPQEIPIDLTIFHKTRAVLKMNAIPVNEAGVYWFLVKYLEGSEWTTWAKIPLEIQYSLPNDPEDPD